MAIFDPSPLTGSVALVLVLVVVIAIVFERFLQLFAFPPPPGRPSWTPSTLSPRFDIRRRPEMTMATVFGGDDDDGLSNRVVLVSVLVVAVIAVVSQYFL